MDVLCKIKHLRDIRGWSNYKLAKMANISEGSLNNLFRLNNQPTISTLSSLCKGLGITLSQFFAESDEAVILNKEQSEMLQVWDTLTDKQKTAAYELLKSISPCRSGNRRVNE